MHKFWQSLKQIFLKTRTTITSQVRTKYLKKCADFFPFR